jgi:hypothetical protein
LTYLEIFPLPHTASHYTTSHYRVLPHTTAYYLILPHTTSHYLTLPHTTSHYLTLPHTTSHYLTLTQPRTTAYYLTLPQLTLPHTTSHYLILPHTTSHCVTIPYNHNPYSCINLKTQVNGNVCRPHLMPHRYMEKKSTRIVLLRRETATVTVKKMRKIAPLSAEFSLQLQLHRLASFETTGSKILSIF